MTELCGGPLQGLDTLTQRITKLWWRFEALFERWKRYMAEGFDDPYDDDPRQGSPFHNRDVAELVRLAGKINRGMNISGGNSGGSKEYWVDYVFKGAVILGIAALVGMTLNTRDTVTRIETYFTAKDKENEREFARIYQTLNGHDQRLDSLEQQRREPDAYRQRR